MALVKAQGVLRHHVEGAAEDTPGFAVGGVGVAGGVDFGTRFVDFRVDCEGGCVDGFVAFDDVAVFVDEDEV